MSLQTYRQKRDFLFTPEPRGGARSRKGEALRFVIQKHAARRLHYDFRLELDGTLKSWAIPKGPSLDPATKRLAVQVEDHPLEYGDFEGVIPAGQYGAGEVLVWDHGWWHPEGDPREAYRKGRLHFRLEGSKLQGSWNLLRLSGNGEPSTKQQWLLIKSHDEHAGADDVVNERPESVLTGHSLARLAPNAHKPGKQIPTDTAPAATARSKNRRNPMPANLTAQLATEVDAVPAGDEWIHEIKYDGYRMLCRVRNGTAQLFSRNGKDWTARFAAVAAAVVKLGMKTAWLDGEVVAWAAGGISSFQALQRNLRDENGTGLTYCVFDLLYRDGLDLSGQPLLARKRALAKALDAHDSASLRFSDHVASGDGAAFFSAACRAGLEGIISKRGDRPYRPGRGTEWVKIKCHQQQEFVIGGYTQPRGSRKGLGALLLGVYDNRGELHYSGRVGTGFSDKVLKELRKALDTRRTSKTPFVQTPSTGEEGVTWVRPELIAQVRFSEWTADSLLRQASFLGLRSDKAPRDVRRESTRAPREPATAKRQADRPSAAAKKTDRVRGIQLTHPDKVLYTEQGITKRELADYFDAVADWLMPHLRHRPLSLLRCPEGRQRSCFYQKHAMQGLPTVVQRVPIRDKEGTGSYLAVDTPAGVIALVQFGVLELHTWGSRIDRIEYPDRLIFDLDPGPDVPWSDVVAAAHQLRARLADLDLAALPKTTGGKGIHIVVPLVRRYDWTQAQDFARAVAQDMARRDAQRFTARLNKSARTGRIFIDWLRNTRGATAVAAYSTRARPGAPVSVPVRWDELTARLRPDGYNLRNLPARLNRLRADPWEEYEQMRGALNARARRELGL